MTNDFYLTLPSNASMKMYPDNTLAHYITYLPQRIDLTGEWKCGLAEIQYPYTWCNIEVDDIWFFLKKHEPVGQTPIAGYYKGPVTLMNHVNKGLSRMWTDKTRAKFSYSSITQKITLHMTPSTEFTIPYLSALVRMLGFEPSVVSSPPAADMTRTHVHPRPGGTDIGLTPSTSVVLPLEEIPDGSYTYRKEAENVVHMDQGFDTIYIYTDVVESRIVGDSLAPLLRALSVSGSHGFGKGSVEDRRAHRRRRLVWTEHKTCCQTPLPG